MMESLILGGCLFVVILAALSVGYVIGYERGIVDTMKKWR